MTRARTSPTTLASAIQEAMRQLGIEDRARQAGIFVVWDEAVGPRISEAARPVSAKRGVATIQVSAPVWAQELTALKPELLRAINERLGSPVIRELRFVVGAVDKGADCPRSGEARTRSKSTG